ncbi:amidohydrolase family protein [Thermodesulfobacteriota bacterium]
MKTDRKYAVVDAQFHYLPRKVMEKVDEMVFQSEEGKALQEEQRDPRRKAKPMTQKLCSIETSLRHMEECGVDMAMIMMPAWTVAGLEACRVLNDGMAKAQREYPGKFLPLAAIPYLDVQDSINELDRVKNELGLKGISILTNQRGVTLDDDRLKPFFKKISELGLPVVIHPPTKQKGIWGGTKYKMDGSVSREYEIIKCFTEVFNGVIPEFPDLNFVFAHYGGGVPFLLGRIMSWFIPPESSGIPKNEIEHPMTIREFEEYGLKNCFNKILDRFYFDMAGTGGWMPAVEYALSSIRSDRLGFASDYPHEMSRTADYRAYIDGIKGLDIPEETKVKILGGNWKTLFKA